MTKQILAISGNDIYSGGGLHADLTTYAVNKLHGFVAVTCLTATTDKGFEIFATDELIFEKQLASLTSVPFSAIKIGLLPNVSLAKRAFHFIQSKKDIPIVLDPVLVFKERQDATISQLRKELLTFFPLVTMVTPNLVEAEILTGKQIKNLSDMKSASKELHDKGAKSVFLKGGSRLNHDKAVDVFYDGKQYHILEAPLSNKTNNGAGCTLSSSLASYLALEKTPIEAAKLAKMFVYQAIERSDDYGVIQYGKN